MTEREQYQFQIKQLLDVADVLLAKNKSLAEQLAKLEQTVADTKTKIENMEKQLRNLD